MKLYDCRNSQKESYKLMKYTSRIFIVAVILMFGVIIAAQGIDDRGQPNDPNINPRANACYTDGTWEDTCVNDWYWTCGWYLIRLEYEIYTTQHIPTFCGGMGASLQITATPYASSTDIPTYTYTPLPDSIPIDEP